MSFQKRVSTDDVNRSGIPRTCLSKYDTDLMAVTVLCTNVLMNRISNAPQHVEDKIHITLMLSIIVQYWLVMCYSVCSIWSIPDVLQFRSFVITLSTTTYHVESLQQNWNRRRNGQLRSPLQSSTNTQISGMTSDCHMTSGGRRTTFWWWDVSWGKTLFRFVSICIRLHANLRQL